MDFEAAKLTLRVYNEQENFKIYTTVKKPSHKKNSKKVKDKETKGHLKCQHKNGVGGTIGNLKNEKVALQA